MSNPKPELLKVVIEIMPGETITIEYTDTRIAKEIAENSVRFIEAMMKQFGLKK